MFFKTPFKRVTAIKEINKLYCCFILLKKIEISCNTFSIYLTIICRKWMFLQKKLRNTVLEWTTLNVEQTRLNQIAKNPSTLFLQQSNKIRTHFDRCIFHFHPPPLPSLPTSQKTGKFSSTLVKFRSNAKISNLEERGLDKRPPTGSH